MRESRIRKEGDKTIGGEWKNEIKIRELKEMKLFFCLSSFPDEECRRRFENDKDIRDRALFRYWPRALFL